MAERNETTTKFKVDISELRASMQEATRQVRLANSEFKAATGGMENWSSSADGLSAKVRQLNSVLEAENKKLEILEKQYELTAKEQGENSKGAQELLIRINNQKAAIGKTERQLNSYSEKLEEAKRSSDDLADGTQQFANAGANLKRTISDQERRLAKLKESYAGVTLEQGQNSKEARELAKKIESLSSELKNNKRKLSDAEKEAEQFDHSLDEAGEAAEDAGKSIRDAGDSAKESEGKFKGFVKNIAGGVVKGLKGVATGTVALVTGFLAAGEASQEFTEDMGKLEAGFAAAGHTAKTAQKSYRDMVGILGETDQSVEAVNHLARLTNDQKELAKWTDIAAGIYGTFGDSLPIEGLTEAANETAKVGKVTGPLADALNWAGISEDKFNKKLEKCNSEKERSTLITETLSKTYEKASEKYKKVNADLIENRTATSDLNAALAETGKISMPITTALKKGVASLLMTMLPGFEQIGQGMAGLVKGTKGSAEMLTSGITVILNTLLQKLNKGVPTILNIGVKLIMSLLQGILNMLPYVMDAVIDIVPQISQSLHAMSPNLITIGIELMQSFLSGIAAMIPQIITQVTEIIPKIINALQEGIPLLLDGAVQFFLAVVKAIPEVMAAYSTAATELIQILAVQFIEMTPQIVSALREGVPLLLNGAIQFLMTIIKAIPEVIAALTAALPEIVQSVADILLQGMPVILDGAVQLLMGLINAIPVIIPVLAASLPQIIQIMVDTFVQGIPMVVDGAIQLLMALIDAIPIIIPVLTANLPKIINSLVTGLVSWSNALVQGAIQLLMGITKAIPVLIQALVPQIPNIVITIIKVLIENIPLLLKSAVRLFMSIVQAIPQITGALVGALGTLLATIFRLVSQIPEKIKEALAQAIPRIAGWANDVIDAVKSIPGKIREIGKNIVQGLWNGISDMTSWVIGKIKGFGESVLGGIKDFFGIHSPSTLMRDQIGKNIVLGIAEGMDKNISSLNVSIRKLTQTAFSNFKAAAKKGNFESVGKIVTESFKKGVESKTKSITKSVSSLIDKAVKTMQKKNKGAKKQFSTMGKNLLDSFEKAYNAQAKKVISKTTETIEKIAETAQKKYDAVIEKRDAFQSTLAEYGSLFTKDEAGNVELADISKDTEYIKQYGSNLAKLKSKISNELMNEIITMSVEEGAEFTKKLLGLDDADLKQYNDAYTDKLNAQNSISKSFFAKELKAIKNEFTGKVAEELSSMKQNLEKIGQDAVSGFLKGFNSKNDKVSKEMKSFAKRLVKSIKKELKIKSPSRVFAEIGMYSSQGYFNGFRENMESLKGSLLSVLPDAARNGKLGGVAESQSLHNTYNFYQTNNSPKALSRLDIYRQTKNQLAFARGV